MGYDTVNGATQEYKEAVKVGYNLRRKVVLMAIWAASPVILYADPTLFGLLRPHTELAGFMYNLALVWLAVGLGGLLFRTVQLFFVRDVRTGLVWLTKIVTDPFHNVRTYYKSPYYLLRGQLMDPMDHAR
jgi:hypothetical protein